MNGWRKKIDLGDQKLDDNLYLGERHCPQIILFASEQHIIDHWSFHSPCFFKVCLSLVMSNCWLLIGIFIWISHWIVHVVNKYGELIFYARDLWVVIRPIDSAVPWFFKQKWTEMKSLFFLHQILWNVITPISVGDGRKCQNSCQDFLIFENFFVSFIDL